MRIDVHSHFMSEKVARTLEKRSHFLCTRFIDGATMSSAWIELRATYGF